MQDYSVCVMLSGSKEQTDNIRNSRVFLYMFSLTGPLWLGDDRFEHKTVASELAPSRLSATSTSWNV